MSFQKKSTCLVIWVWFFVPSVAAQSVLVQQSIEQQLAMHPYWLRLLHYQQPLSSPAQWSLQSDVVSKHFFLSSEGHVNPQAELQATLESFFKKPTDNPNQHAQCRFIARFHWLQSQLEEGWDDLPQVQCPKFEEWVDLSKVSSISFIFVSSYMNNPASVYGHNLLKINSKGSPYSHSLLSPTINFGAVVDAEDSAVMYGLKGLFGGYQGRYTDERFYNYNHIYGESELRDLWEYELNLSKEQQHRIIFHLWEMLHEVEFDYYFFLDNCAYRIAQSVEMAWDEKRLNPAGAFWAIPVSNFYRILDIEHEGEPLVQSIELIPSRQRRLRSKVLQLNVQEQMWVKRLLDDISLMDQPGFKSLNPGEQSNILDTLIDYYQYFLADSGVDAFELSRQKVLLYRSQLPPIQLSLQDKHAVPPTEGTPPTQWSLGTGMNHHLGAFWETSVWTSYHHFLGNEKGQLPLSQLITAHLKLRTNEQQHWYLQQFTVFDLQAWRRSPTHLDASKPWSWNIRGGWESRDLRCEFCLGSILEGGFGKVWDLWSSASNLYLGLNGFWRAGSTYQQGHSTGLTPLLQWHWSWGEQMRSLLVWQHYESYAGDALSETKVAWTQNFIVDTWQELQLKWTFHQTTEVFFSYHRYW